MTSHPGKILRFSGPCSITAIEQHRQDLLRAFADGTAVSVDLSVVDSVDVSFIQLTLSAARTAAKRGGSFAVLNVPDAVAASFQGAGVDIASLIPT